MKKEIIRISRAEIRKLLKKENLLEFNRVIKPRHVAAMAESVAECGVLRLPVIGDVSDFDHRDKVIIDGQHILTAIIRQDKDDDFYEDLVLCLLKKYENKAELIHDISKLNNTQKSWGDEEYLNAWYRYGKDNVEHIYFYKRMKQMYDDLGGVGRLPLGFIIDTYTADKKAFKNGKLSFRDEELSEKILAQAIHLRTTWDVKSFALHGLKMWIFNWHYVEKKEIDFLRLQSRLDDAHRLGRAKSIKGREEYRDFVEEQYTRL